MATAPAAATKSAPKATAAPKLPVWVWEGKTKSGEVKRGEVEASDEASVQQRLRAMALTNVRSRRSPSRSRSRSRASAASAKKDWSSSPGSFATMIDAGLPLVQCLDILSSQLDNMAFREVLTKVKVKVESGSTLADALGDHPKVFDTLYVQLVAAGENRRYPRHDPQPPRAVHREEREAEEQGEERDGLPQRGAGGRHRRHRRAAALRHPDLREDVQGLRRRDADADADRDRSLEMAAALHRLPGRRHHRRGDRFSAPGCSGRAGGCSGTPSSSARRSSGRWCARWRWPGSPARWAR